jgi:hypothetical protein
VDVACTSPDEGLEFEARGAALGGLVAESQVSLVGDRRGREQNKRDKES